MTKFISSSQNATIKYLKQLQEKSRNRRKDDSFVIEGLRELSLAIQSNYLIRAIYFCSDLITEQHLKTYIDSDLALTEISTEVYKKLAYRNSTEGIIALAESKSHSINDLKLSKKPLILVAEAPEKPGNIGALLRTADAAKLDAVIIANPKTDLYNPNIIRSSVGCLFTTQIAVGETSEIISYLTARQITMYAATLQSSKAYHLQDFTEASAIVVGTEATGLSQNWRDHSAENIIIPMQGAIDSMNVSVSAGILIFEAKRQRGFS